MRVGDDSSRNNPVCGTISLEQINAHQKVHLTCDLHGKYLSVEVDTWLQLCEVYAFECQGKQLNQNEEICVFLW